MKIGLAEDQLFEPAHKAQPVSRNSFRQQAIRPYLYISRLMPKT